MIDPAIAADDGPNGGVTFRYTNVAILAFLTESPDVAQVLNDIASNIQHLIE